MPAALQDGKMTSQSEFPLDQALLGFLMQGPAHGYALHDRADEELGRIWYMGMSNVYGTLKQLEKDGHVEATLEDEGYPPRKVYTITPSGRGRFLAWVREPVPAVRDMRVEFLAKLYFFHALELEGLGALLTGQKMACLGRLNELEKGAVDGGDVFDEAVYAFRRRRIEATLAWLETVERAWT
jgi:DNA-binding PadR family transcriptional regulator